MNTKARMTFRFGKESGANQKQETPAAGKTYVAPYFQEDLKFTLEAGTWNSPFQDDAHLLEQLIRDADPKGAEQPQRSVNRPDEPKAASVEAAVSNLPFSQEEDSEWIEKEAETAAPIELGDTEPLQQAGQPTEPVERNRIAADINRPPAAKELMDSSGPIIDPEVFENRSSMRKSSFATVTKYRSSKGPSWYKVFASVAGAVATGALFGYLALSLFTGSGIGGGSETGGQPASETAVSKPTDAVNQSGNTGADASVGSGMNQPAAGTDEQPSGTEGPKEAGIAVNVPAATFHVLQYGVFSNEEGMKAAIAELQDKGLNGASLSTGEDYRVYVGLSTERSGAEALSSSLSDIAVYAKQLEVPALTTIAFNGKAEEVESFFALTHELINELDNFSVDELVGAEASGADWKDTHVKWTKAVAGMLSGIQGDTGKANLNKLVKAIGSAVSAANEYGKKPSDAHLWTIQAALMDAVFSEKAWFASPDAL